MRGIWVGVLLVAGGLAVGCDAAGDASCAVCQTSFTTAECDQMAKTHGCSSGEAYQDTVCQPPTQGCQFHGCPDNVDPCELGADAVAE